MNASAVRDALSAERAVTLARIGAMTSEFEDMVAAAVGSNDDDEHDPEGSTLAFERAQVAALLLEARAYLGDLDRAVTRVDAGDYWNCEACSAPIAPERLAARPATTTCIGCAARQTGSPSHRRIRREMPRT
jgi:RNA polymerase-binding transcription factor DksA